MLAIVRTCVRAGVHGRTMNTVSSILEKKRKNKRRRKSADSYNVSTGDGRRDVFADVATAVAAALLFAGAAAVGAATFHTGAACSLRESGTSAGWGQNKTLSGCIERIQTFSVQHPITVWLQSMANLRFVLIHIFILLRFISVQD